VPISCKAYDINGTDANNALEIFNFHTQPLPRWECAVKSAVASTPHTGHWCDHDQTTGFDPQETFVPRQRTVGPARKRSFAPDRRLCLRQDHVSSSSSAFASFRSPVSKPSVNQP
jgi:hypothetical protein